MLPDQLFKLAQGHWEAAADLGLQACIECGLCDRACPSEINLASIFTQAKRIEAHRRQDTEHKADIKQRYDAHAARLQEREYGTTTARRKITKRRSKTLAVTTSRLVNRTMKRTGNRTANIMLKVLAALVPGLLAQSYYLGPGVLVNGMVLTLSCSTALIVVLRKPNNLRASCFGMGNGTTLLIAWLIAVCLPPNVPVSCHSSPSRSRLGKTRLRRPGAKCV